MLPRHTHFFVRITSLKIYQNILNISRDIRIRIYLTVQKERFYPEMQFATVLLGAENLRKRRLKLSVIY